MLDGVDGVKWVWVCVSVGCRGGGVGVDVWMCGCCVDVVVLPTSPTP